MRRKRLLFAMAFLVIGALGGNLYAQVSWESVTNLIQNPSFESSTAASDLTTGPYSNGTLDGWTVTGEWTNAQYGVANSETKIQGIGTSFSPSNGNNYFFTRNNWNNNTTYLISQTVEANGDNLPAGLYKLSCQTATYSSSASFNTIRLSLQEGDKTAATTDGIVLNVWNEWGVIVYKKESDSNLTISATMIPGSSGGGQHYCLLLDDFKLEYISPAALQTASESNTVDFTALINNANIYNHSSKTNLPRGWAAFSHTTGNGNYTEGTNDTQLEGWSGGNLDIDYYQDIYSLPKGAYNVTAYVHSTSNAGEVYINESGNKKTSPSMSSDYADLTTESLKVTGGHISMGIQANTNNSWVTGDNFRLSMVAPCIETIAISLPESGEMEAEQWYYVDFQSHNTLSAENGAILITQDGEELTTSTITESFITKEIAAGRYYIKSSSSNKVEIIPPIVEDGIYYLYNQWDDNGSNDEHRFLARGKDWGTRAVIDEYGIPVQITNQGGDIVTLKFVDTNQYIKDTWWMYTDGGEDVANTFKVLESTVDGVEGYHFATIQVNDDINARQFMYAWLKDTNSNDYYAVAGNGADEVEGDFSRTVWKLLSPAERNAIVDNYPVSNFRRVFDAEDVSYDQLDYYIQAKYNVLDVTNKIGTPTFENGALGNWTYSQVRGGDPGFGSGLVELYQKNGTFSQTITGLDEGIYKLTVNAFERHGNSDAAKRFGNDYGNIGSAYLSANNEKAHIASWHEAYSGTNDPSSMGQAATKFSEGNYVNELYVKVGSDGNLTINVGFPGFMGMAEWFIMNNFTLTYYAPNEKTIATPEGKYYLRNKATGEYMTFDGYWGTYYSMSDAGKELTLETSDEGFTLMHTTYLSNSDDVTSSTDTENYFYSYPANPYHAFSDGNSTGGGEKWVFYELGENTGVYNIMNYMTGNYLSGEQGYDEANLGWGGLLKETASSDDPSVQWELVSFDDLKSALTADGASYPQNASFLIGEPDFIAGWNNVYEEFYRWKVLGNDQYKYSSWNTNDITTFVYNNDGWSEGNSTYAACIRADYPDILQTIENVPAGLYVVECQAVFRDGDGGDATGAAVTSSSRRNADRLADKTYVNRAYLYANENMASAPTDDAMAMRDRAWIYENAQLMPVNIATTSTFYNAADPAIRTQFRDKAHTVQIPIYVTDSNDDGTGTLTIGVLQEIGINDNMLAFDRFRLTYYGTSYSGDEVKNIEKSNLERLASDYTNYQSNTVIDKENNKVTAAIASIDNETDYNTNSETIAKYNKITQDYGETSISWYIYNVLVDDYEHGIYTTAKDQNRTDGIYPYVDEACKKEVVRYFGADPENTNNKNVYNGETYAEGELVGKFNMGTQGTLADLRAAITALRTYVAANAEARYIEDEKVIDNEIADTEEARAESRMARMALVTGSKEAITTEDGKYPAYQTNPLMFTNAGVSIEAPELDKIVTNARCWAPRDAYGHRFYDYKNYYHYGAGQESTYEIKIDGLMTGKYLVTISESHNNELASVRFNAFVGNNQIVTDKELFRTDESIWQTYTHSWQDVSCVAEITDQFEPVTLQFIGGGENSAAAATMNICNLRIYRLDDVEMLLLDENDTQLAKNGDSENGYNSVKVLLKREMQTNQWNTLTLPVSLTKEQVLSGFGEGTILAVMDGFATDYDTMFSDPSEYPDNCIHFKTNDLSSLQDEDIAIAEGKVYLIKPTADPAVAAGETAKYKNPYEGQPIYIDVEGPIYYLDYVKYTLKDYGSEGKECNIIEKDPDTGEILSTTVRTHSDPEAGTPIEASGAQTGKLSLQMDGTYVTKVVPVGENDYVYAFQNQSGTVNVVQLDPQYSKTYEGFGDTVGRKFKGFRGWATANYSGDTSVKSAFTVILNDEEDTPTIIRGIDSKDSYSEIRLNNQGIYDLQGRRIASELFNSPACPKGVYIVNGKKVLVK